MRYREALTHRDAGVLDEARRALEPLVHGDTVYVPAAVAYANVLRAQSKQSEARRILEMLCDALPAHPVLLFNLAGVCAEESDYKAARRHLDAVDTEDLPPGLAHAVEAAATTVTFLTRSHSTPVFPVPVAPHSRRYGAALPSLQIAC